MLKWVDEQVYFIESSTRTLIGSVDKNLLSAQSVYQGRYGSTETPRTIPIVLLVSHFVGGFSALVEMFVDYVDDVDDVDKTMEYCR